MPNREQLLAAARRDVLQWMRHVHSRGASANVTPQTAKALAASTKAQAEAMRGWGKVSETPSVIRRMRHGE